MNRLRCMRVPLLAAGVIMATLFGRCSLEPFSGGGTEGGNVVAGAFIDDNGMALAKVTVLLLPSDYNPAAADLDKPITTVKTAGDGSYAFNRVPKGRYSIEAVHTESGKRSLVTDVDVAGDDVQIPSDTLRTPGAIRVYLPPSADAATGYVYVPGTTLYSRYTGVTGHVVVSALPAKRLPAVCYATLSDPTPVFLRYGVSVTSDDTVAVARTEGWKFSRRIYLNTTASGAGVMEQVTGFAAIVRLTGENFDFALAKTDGSDIRFARADTIRLPYEIERWDPVAKRAEVWVRIDTVRGNSDAQFITMYWGNAAAADSSDGAAVFPAADNYAAVWHLNQGGSDATVARHDAVASSAIDATGIIGYGKRFRGSDSMRIAGLLGSPQSITLSAWAQLDSTVPGGGSDILSLGDAVLIRMDYNLDSIGTIGAIHLPGDSTFFNVTSRKFFKKTGWHLVTYTFDYFTGSHILYIDGTRVAARTDVTKSIVYSGVGQDTYIGKHGNGKTNFNFNGSIDEVRVCRAAVSPDYARLCFMNQKQQDALVLFR